jgi:hypothetical protein
LAVGLQIAQIFLLVRTGTVLKIREKQDRHANLAREEKRFS